MELEQYVAVVRRWWWLMVACVVVATGSSYYGTLQMPRIYQATTTVMVGQVMEQANPSSQDLYISTQLAQTYANMVTRRPVLEGAAQALGLAFVPSAENVSTRQVAGTQLLEISVRDTVPERARVLADEIANQLILQSPAASEDQQRQTFAREQLSDLEGRIAATEEEIEAEQEQLDAANSARAIQQYQANISALEQRLSSYQSTYASLLTSVEGGTNYVSIVEPASTPTHPISPNVPETVALAGAIGLALAAGGAFLIEYMDDTVKSPDDVARATELPILGTIAHIGGQHYADKLVAAQDPRSPITEAYRALRTNIRFSTVDKPAQTLMLTSPSPSEGKSITLVNLAVVMAQAGLKVIAVDSDLRRPVLGKVFHLSNNSGLSNAILEPESGLTNHLRATDVENLRVLPSGSLPPNPAELMGSERMAAIVEELNAEADVVLFDSPPVLAVTDAAVLSTHVDGVLMVCNAGRTRRGDASKGVEELRRVGANLLGAVVNRLSPRHGARTYYYYYYGDSEATEGKRPAREWLDRLQRLLLFGKDSPEKGSRDHGQDEGHEEAEAPRRLGRSFLAGVLSRIYGDSEATEGKGPAREWLDRLQRLLSFGKDSPEKASTDDGQDEGRREAEAPRRLGRNFLTSVLSRISGRQDGQDRAGDNGKLGECRDYSRSWPELPLPSARDSADETTEDADPN